MLHLGYTWVTVILDYLHKTGSIKLHLFQTLCRKLVPFGYTNFRLSAKKLVPLGNTNFRLSAENSYLKDYFCKDAGWKQIGNTK